MWIIILTLLRAKKLTPYCVSFCSWEFLETEKAVAEQNPVGFLEEKFENEYSCSVQIIKINRNENVVLFYCYFKAKFLLLFLVFLSPIPYTKINRN